MVFILFEYLDAVNCNHRSYSMFNFGNFLTKNAINFDVKEIERKKRYLVGMKFCFAFNAAIKKCQNRKNKNQLFSQNIFNKSTFFKKYGFFLKNKRYIFRFWRFFLSF